MKKLHSLLLAASLALAAVQPAVASKEAAKPTPSAAAQPAFFLENPSGRDFYGTLKSLDEAIKTAKWSVLASHRMHENMAEKGHKVGRTTILEVCSMKYGLEILKDDKKKYVSSMMPCRISVYETADGRVVVSRLNAHAFADMLGANDPALAKVMREAGAEIEQIIAQSLAK
ncbi:MAG: DUF302 domain-containing protein [Thiobacillus sp.]